MNLHLNLTYQLVATESFLSLQLFIGLAQLTKLSSI